jgi:ADP-ribosyl-[dinitrogen reductase] hydrolase
MMTLGVAEGILSAPNDPMHEIGEQFLKWYRTNPKDIGNIIRKVLHTYEGNWYEAAFLADMDLGQSAGNGSLMRCLPVALCYPHIDDLEKISRMQSRMTHYDERCDQVCILYNRMISRLLREEELHAVLASELKDTEYETALRLQPDCEPNGFVVNTFRWVLYIVATSTSFAEVVQRAANKGGDADTIAAIAGGMAGVYYGYEGIPSAYVESIIIKDRLHDISARMVELRVHMS